MRNFLYLRTSVETFWELNLPIGFSPFKVAHTIVWVFQNISLLKGLPNHVLCFFSSHTESKTLSVNPVNISSSYLFTWIFLEVRNGCFVYHLLRPFFCSFHEEFLFQHFVLQFTSSLVSDWNPQKHDIS